MISLICYFWILMWNIEKVGKEAFVFMSTFELAFELIVLIVSICVYLPDWIREHRRNND